MSSSCPEKEEKNKKPSKQKVAAELNKLAELLYDEYLRQQAVPQDQKE